ncbi:hypothetical protein Hdeb2414_s0027g00695001 [Helianthus debilis subsp. tardiflorus]
MYLNSTNEYYRLVRGLDSYSVPENVIDSLLDYESSIARSELQNRFSAPMFWIGMYIALASLVCILAMVADLLHGFRSRKLWFPCKYFRINAAFLTIISVAMKLPVDLTGSMPGAVDKAAKLGSMAFMCTMMANLLPCLATMGSNELLSNIIALCVLVITLVVNVCIQIRTGVLSTYVGHGGGIYKAVAIDISASIYVTFLVVLLIVHVCSSVAILKSKKIIESKYQQGHARALKDIQPSPGELLTPDKLQKHVSNHWIMAGSGSPQFITACFHTTSATGAVLGSWGKKFENLEENNDLRPYILQLEDEIELGDRTLKRLSRSVNRFIKRGAKSQPNNLMKLVLEKSTSGFQGVKNFDHYDDQDVPFVDCWRLPVVTLTTIAVSFPKIEKKEVDNLLESVREGLVYVTVVEKSFNGTDDHVNFQRAAETLWQGIIFDKNWLGNELQDRAFQVKTDEQIVEWFRDKAKNIICSEGINKDDTIGVNDHLVHRSICASSMYRITETILLTFRTNIDVTVSQKKLFDDLSSMIADIIAACLTNLPQAITMKCHTSVMEEREDSVKEAAQLLGETTEIIKTLQDRDIPGMNPSDFPFIDKWRAYLGNP